MMSSHESDGTVTRSSSPFPGFSSGSSRSSSCSPSLLAKTVKRLEVDVENLSQDMFSSFCSAEKSEQSVKDDKHMQELSKLQLSRSRSREKRDRKAEGKK